MRKSKLFECAQQVVVCCGIAKLVTLQAPDDVMPGEPSILLDLCEDILVDHHVSIDWGLCMHHQLRDMLLGALIIDSLLVDHHALNLLPFRLVLLFLSLFDFFLQALIVQGGSNVPERRGALRPQGARFFFNLFVFLVVHTVVQLRIIVCLVLSVHLLDLGGEFEYLLVDHEILDRVMTVEVFIDVRPSRVEGSQDNRFRRDILDQAILGRVE